MGIAAKRKLDVLARRFNLPAFLILGAQKCGTSSLHDMLGHHPGIAASSPKEVNYFTRRPPETWNARDYATHFPGPRRHLHFEATPEYLSWPNLPGPLSRIVPGIRMIVLLREPTARAYSAWNHYRTMFDDGRSRRIPRDWPGVHLYEAFFEGRTVFPSFRECVDIELDYIERGEGHEPAILRRGLYIDHLEAYWRHFDREQVLVVGLRDLERNPKDTLNEVCRFLGAAERSWDDIDHRPRNVHAYSSPPPAEDAAVVGAFYAEANRRLEVALGSLPW